MWRQIAVVVVTTRLGSTSQTRLGFTNALSTQTNRLRTCSLVSFVKPWAKDRLR